jgi:hypothetical protein
MTSLAEDYGDFYGDHYHENSCGSDPDRHSRWLGFPVGRIVRTECAGLARMYHKGLLTRTMLLKSPGRCDEGPRGRTVVMKAGGLPWQPANQPYVVVRTVIQAFIPAPFGAPPHPIHPSIRRCRRVPRVFPIPRRRVLMCCWPKAQVVYLLLVA